MDCACIDSWRMKAVLVLQETRGPIKLLPGQQNATSSHMNPLTQSKRRPKQLVCLFELTMSMENAVLF